jgi:hypothetical protein
MPKLGVACRWAVPLPIFGASVLPAQPALLPPLADPIPALAAPEPRAQAPWPELAAVFPGVLVHGSGTWLQGRTDTTERLLLLEAAGLLAIASGGLVIYETGAARDWAGLATFTVAAGAGTLGTSLLASLYATWAPASGFGEPVRRLPLLVSALGYSYAADPQFDDHHFLTTQVDGRLGAWRLAFDSAYSPAPGNQWLALLAGYRVLGPRAGSAAAPDGSYLEPQLAFSSHRFAHSGFSSQVLQLDVEGRLDSERLFTDVHGAFFQATAGLAQQWLAYDVPGAQALDASGMLVFRMGFGMYVGARGSALAAAPGGEAEIYYDHRRDGFAGGLKLPGPISGFAGHVGLRSDYYFSEAWGLRALAELGSHWVLGVSALLRVGAP